VTIGQQTPVGGEWEARTGTLAAAAAATAARTARPLRPDVGEGGGGPAARADRGAGMGLQQQTVGPARRNDAE